VAVLSMVSPLDRVPEYRRVKV